MQTSLRSGDDLVRHLERIRFVTRNFQNLQGLWVAWWGLLAVLYVVDTALWSYSIPYQAGLSYNARQILVDIQPIAAILAFFFVWIRLGSYYRERFGIVQAKSFPALSLVLSLCWITSHLPLSDGQRLYFIVGLSWFVVGVWRPQMDRVALGLGILALGALKSFRPDLVDFEHFAIFLCGTATLVAGLLDHRLLVRTLGPALDREPASELEHAEAAEVAQS
jgi:hypothetical protein